MTRIIVTGLFLLLFPVLAAASDDVLVTVKLAKTIDAPIHFPVLIGFPADCARCTQIDDPAYAKDNAKEVVLAFRIPKSHPVALSIRCSGRYISSVILEDHRLPFVSQADSLNFVVPAQIADRPDSGEFQTHLFWRGVELRFEHGDPSRRSGKYATGPFPTVQRAAASNIEFGLLEAIWRLGLDSYVDQENLGRLFLMGFDTNEPHAHEDFPPHFHLTLWLPTYQANGSLIPHVYLTDSGSIDKSLVGIFGWNMPSNFLYKPGETFTARDVFAHPVFTLTFTREGSILLGRSDGVRCSVDPYEGAFSRGAAVQCPSFPRQVVSITDDLEHSRIKETIDGNLVRTFRYDPETGEPI